MRIIDADELIKVIKDRAGYSSATAFVRNMQKLSPVQVFKHIMKLIEQAPTVELTAFFMRQQAEDELIRIRAEADQRGYQRGYNWGLEVGKHLKQPTGEWKCFIGSAYYGVDEFGEPIWRKRKIYHCPYCNRRTVIKENYCPTCGVMLKGKEDD